MTEHIKIGNITPHIQYQGDGTETNFTYPFPIFEDADIEVYVDTTLMTLTTEYMVSDAGESGGGIVTFVTAPADQIVVTLLRKITIKRTTDFQESGELRMKVLNNELDKQTAMLQQVKSDQDRSLRLGPTDSATSTIVPDKATRSSKVLAFDANGNPTVSTMDVAGIESGATDAAISAAAAAKSAKDADVFKIIWKGNWGNTTGYELNDAVQNVGASYICIQAHTGQAPPNPAFWNIMAARGLQGVQGIQGPQGNIANPLEFHGFNVTADGSLEWTHDVTGTFNAKGFAEWTTDVPGLAYSINTTTGNLELA